MRTERAHLHLTRIGNTCLSIYIFLHLRLAHWCTFHNPKIRRKIHCITTAPGRLPRVQQRSPVSQQRLGDTKLCDDEKERMESTNPHRSSRGIDSRVKTTATPSTHRPKKHLNIASRSLVWTPSSVLQFETGIQVYTSTLVFACMGLLCQTKYVTRSNSDG